MASGRMAFVRVVPGARIARRVRTGSVSLRGAKRSSIFRRANLSPSAILFASAARSIQPGYFTLSVLIFRVLQRLQPSVEYPMPNTKADFANNSDCHDYSKNLD